MTWKRVRPILLGLSSLVLVIVGWEVEYHAKLVNTTFLPGPWVVAKAMKTVVASGTFPTDLKVSAEEFALGLGISIVVGAGLGILTGWYKWFDEFLKPIVVALNCMPHLAVIPLLILIFGIGMTPKIVVVLLSCIVVMLMNTASGVQNVDQSLMRLSKSCGASDLQIIRTIVAPSVIPFFMTGLRLSVGRAVIGVVTGEIFGSQSGLGNILINAQGGFNMPVMYATVIILTLLGIVLTQAAGWFEGRMQRWKA
ncbi:putative ABC transporter permease [Actinacidiphila reveromycinica]|uniref:Putative ABC transporter permease n=2 Tax=Actinacidiphila reveromycinica TaxID=659352 RepID=A0A7U3UZA6_9ACTN|nr:putative ABC transporter permease [Streptomyces sp. SN-593]